MHELEILLENKEGLRLMVLKSSDQRNTMTEHELRFKAKFDADHHLEHSKLGPWIIKSSKWIS